MVLWEIERAPTSIRLLLGLAAEHGVPPAVCLARTRLSEGLLQEPATAVSAREEMLVIENLVRALGDPPGLGLEAGVRYHLTTFGIWGYGLITSASLREAMELGVRFVDLTFAFCRFQFRGRDRDIRMVLDTPEVPIGVRRFVVEREAASIHTLQQELLVTGSSVNHVRFEFDAGDAAARYTQVFGVTPEFGAGENAVGFDYDMLHRPLPQANEDTAAIVEGQCRQLLAARYARFGLAGRVRRLLMARPSRPPTLEQVAAALNMSDRTLRRRLAEEGTTFRCLLDEIREQLAEELLVTAGMTVGEVANRLGYLEVSSFSQAFRRWKGVGPRAYRSRQPA